MWKECNVVMLPTNEKARIYKEVSDRNILIISNHPDQGKKGDYIGQHLYITSSEVIKENDWCIDIWNNEIIQMNKATKDMLDTGMLHNPHALIIATTDISLKFGEDIPGIIRYKSLPQPSQQFIEKYIEEYNKGNFITDILVEYEDKFLGYFPHVTSAETGSEPHYEIRLKVNSDNTINFKPIKVSWSIEEVRNVCNQMRLDLDKTNSISNESFIDWIENNL